MEIVKTAVKEVPYISLKACPVCGEHPELKKELWGGHLWNPSYFVVTVSERSNEQVRRYIEEQRTK